MAGMGSKKNVENFCFAHSPGSQERINHSASDEFFSFIKNTVISFR